MKDIYSSNFVNAQSVVYYPQNNVFDLLLDSFCQIDVVWFQYHFSLKQRI